MESMKPRVCLIVAFYNGANRAHGEGGESFLTYLTKQKACLRKYKHSLDTIVFAIAEDDRTNIEIVKEAGITYIYRPNWGMSFGSWVDVVNIYRGKFDYYIFGEDDYLFVKDNFDEILVNTYSKRSEDYIVNWSDGKPRGLTSTIGIVSKAALEKHRFLEDYWKRIGSLPHGTRPDSCQCMWSFSLTIGDGWSAGKWGLEHENNCFPYFCSAGGVYMFGYDHESTPVENARRVLLACAQSVGAEGEHKFISMMPGLETWPGS